MKRTRGLQIVGALGALLALSTFVPGCLGFGDDDGDNVPHHDDSESMEAKRSKRINALRSRNRKLAEKLSSYLGEGEVRAVEGSYPSQCGGTRQKYRLSRGSEGLKVSTSILFEGNLSGEDFERSKQVLEDCWSTVSEIYQRSGIELDVLRTYRLKESVPVPTSRPQEFDHFVEVLLGEKRSNAGQYYALATGYWKFSCVMFAHELGHLLGLADEYSETGTCRDEEYAATPTTPYNLMGAISSADRTDFYPRNIYQLADAAFPAEVQLSYRSDALVSTQVRDLRKWTTPQPGVKFFFDSLFNSQPLVGEFYLTETPDFVGTGKQILRTPTLFSTRSGSSYLSNWATSPFGDVVLKWSGTRYFDAYDFPGKIEGTGISYEILPRKLPQPKGDERTLYQQAEVKAQTRISAQ